MQCGNSTRMAGYSNHLQQCDPWVKNMSSLRFMHYLAMPSILVVLAQKMFPGAIHGHTWWSLHESSIGSVPWICFPSLQLASTFLQSFCCQNCTANFTVNNLAVNLARAIHRETIISPLNLSGSVSTTIDAVLLKTITITAETLQCLLLNAPILDTFTTTTDSLTYAYFNSPSPFGIGTSKPVNGTVRVFAPNSPKVTVSASQAGSVIVDSQFATSVTITAGMATAVNITTPSLGTVTVTAGMSQAVDIYGPNSTTVTVTGSATDTVILRVPTTITKAVTPASANVTFVTPPGDYNPPSDAPSDYCLLGWAALLAKMLQRSRILVVWQFSWASFLAQSPAEYQHSMAM